MYVIFREDFAGLVFKVAPVKTPRDELTSYPPADMSTVIPQQHAIYFEGTQPCECETLTCSREDIVRFS